MTTPKEQKNVVFDFCRSPTKRLLEVESGDAPKESMLGYYWLGKQGYPVTDSSDRWENSLGSTRSKLAGLLELPSFKMINTWAKADVIVITTRFSIILALIGKLLGKRVVFYDSMQDLPKSIHRKLLVWGSTMLADKVIGYSQFQTDCWINLFPHLKNKMIAIPYGVDCSFYKSKNTIKKPDNKPFLIAVGRDPSRDFNTLLSVLEEIDWELKLVTMSYLVPRKIRENQRVNIVDGLSYDDLFDLYKQSSAAIIPIKKNTTHMSGIRAAMEAMLLEVPVIVARTEGLAEIFTHGDNVIFYEPGDEKSLTEAIEILSSASARETIVANARQLILEQFHLNKLVENLWTELQSA